MPFAGAETGPDFQLAGWEATRSGRHFRGAPIEQGRGGKVAIADGAPIQLKNEGLNCLEPSSPRMFRAEVSIRRAAARRRDRHTRGAPRRYRRRVPQRVHHGVLGSHGCAREPVPIFLLGLIQFFLAPITVWRVGS